MAIPEAIPSKSIPRVKRIAHIVLYVRDPQASAGWYCDVLGMRISAKVPEGPYAGGIFLSIGEHDHDLALFPAAAVADRGQEFEHIGLEVDCDGDLDEDVLLCGTPSERAFYAAADGKENLYSRLAAGSPPDWLVEVSLPTSLHGNARLYETRLQAPH